MMQTPNVDGGSIELDLQGIQEGTHPLVLDGGEGPLAVGAEDCALRDFRLEGTISRVGGDYRVRGSLSGILETACDRCLTRFDREVHAEVDVRAVVAEVPPEGAIRLASDSRVLDLTAPCRESVLLEVPIKNLCREDCRGICPRCGANRNLKPCDCATEPRDPRWDALKGLSFTSDSSDARE